MAAEQVYIHAPEVAGAERSADRIIPKILDIIGPVKSVVDVGGGTGAWLRAFRNHGAERIHLVDHPSAASDLLVEPELFESCDLSKSMPKLGKYDLAVSVECAEHIPTHQSEAMVECLANAADIVVFSAGAPFQPGRLHINNQPATFWRDLFAKHGMQRHDVLRQPLLHDEEVPWWYRQNLFLFARPGRLTNLAPDFMPEGFTIVHDRCVPPPLHLRRLIGEIPSAIATAIRNRLS